MCYALSAIEVIEESNEDDDISGLLRDLAAGLDDRGDFDEDSSVLEPSVELHAIQNLVAENSKELYPNCKKYTQLHFLVRLLHLKLLEVCSEFHFEQITSYVLFLFEQIAKFYFNETA